MDYRKAAQGVLDAIGGKENILSAAHCATRLRLVIADNQKADRTGQASKTQNAQRFLNLHLSP